jgi:hypothetical protein
MPVLLLLVGVFGIALLRVYLPIPAKIEGKPFGTLTLAIPEKVLLQRLNLYVIAGVVVLGAVGGFITGPLEFVAIVATFALLLIPAKYTFTSRGIAFNNVVFRSWTDFSGYRFERTGLVLEGAEGQRAFRLHVVGAHRDAAVRAVSRYLAAVGEGASPRRGRAANKVRRNGVTQSS